MRLVSNTNKPNDRMSFLLEKHGKDRQIYIASAFFSEADLLLKMVEDGCSVRLIVRLDYGTSSEALKKIIGNDKIAVRFFTGKNFHPKFYIFENEVAYLGSSNLTYSGIKTNQEANVEIDCEEPVFDDLKQQFFEYWKNAEVLTENTLEKFTNLMKELQNELPQHDYSGRIQNEIGVYEYNNVGREKAKGNEQKEFVSSFKKSYQLFIKKFNLLKAIYEKTGVRKYPDIPLRIEVDKFLNWIRVNYATGNSYSDVALKSDIEIEKTVRQYCREFESADGKFGDGDRFLTVSQGFSDKNRINGMNFEEIFEILNKTWAFHDQFRFCQGGHIALKNEFKAKNKLDDIKKMIIYLLFGEGEYEKRVCDCCLGAYKLKQFGEACVKELYGLTNHEEIPIYNGRTSKSMQWLGFGKL